MVAPSGVCKYIVPSVSCWIDELRFVRSEPSNMHCCYTFPFALALLFLYLLVRPEAIAFGAGLCFTRDVFMFYFNTRSPRCVGRSAQKFAW